MGAPQFDECFRQLPVDAEVFFVPVIRATLAHFLYYARQYPEAARQSSEAVRLDSDSVMGRLKAALAYAQLKNYDDAIRQAETANPMTESDSRALAILAYAEARASRKSNSQQILPEILHGTMASPFLSAAAYMGLGIPRQL